MAVREYTTSAGVRLTLKPVSRRVTELAMARVKRDYQARGEPVDPPPYVVKGMGGEELVLRLTEDLLTVTGDEAETQRRHALWAAHRDAMARMEADQREASVQALFALGIEAHVPPVEEWLPELLYVDPDLKLPEDPRDLKVFWLVHCAMTDLDYGSVMGAMTVLATGGDVKPEDVELFRRTAGDTMGRAFRQAAEGVGNVLERAMGGGGEVQ